MCLTEQQRHFKKWLREAGSEKASLSRWHGEKPLYRVWGTSIPGREEKRSPDVTPNRQMSATAGRAAAPRWEDRACAGGQEGAGSSGWSCEETSKGQSLHSGLSELIWSPEQEMDRLILSQTLLNGPSQLPWVKDLWRGQGRRGWRDSTEETGLQGGKGRGSTRDSRESRLVRTG